ncbi:hypothetical protein GCM10011571_12240 [Marinithermofilum abyssi]|uniref:Uncharacterized protein n=1 Tax=Marinithermofilum abyssi TaxID=1571185 RepID=A0A8J2VFV6_9BACL|nr:hypothetical protein [Marinithermofilum abyssi]GGE12392.1 hypothetical protein GCM10011571_12240 [Marinithermofilum abyssi]
MPANLKHTYCIGITFGEVVGSDPVKKEGYGSVSDGMHCPARGSVVSEENSILKNEKRDYMVNVVNTVGGPIVAEELGKTIRRVRRREFIETGEGDCIGSG